MFCVGEVTDCTSYSSHLQHNVLFKW